MTDMPVITFGHAPRYDGDLKPHHVEVLANGVSYHGQGATQDEALINAACAWNGYMRKQREIEQAQPCPKCQTGRLISGHGGGVVCHANCGYWFCY